MDYIEFTFTLTPANETNAEIFMALLAEQPFESFEVVETGLKAFMPSEAYNREGIAAFLKQLSVPACTFEYSTKVIPRTNWNAQWEQNFFEPIIINDQCLIKSSFHTDTPKLPYQIVIDPKMSFGTGHHSTTTLMVQEILKLNLDGKSVLDMGCGTGILAILAAMRNAKDIEAIDIDEWAYDNTKENIITNNTPAVKVGCGGAELLDGNSYDIILANINRNILLNDMETYASCLEKGGILIMSGFYQHDIAKIEEKANNLWFKLAHTDVLNDWAVTFFEKTA